MQLVSELPRLSAKDRTALSAFGIVPAENPHALKLAKHDHRPVERITFQGFPISIENPAGTYREWGHHRDKEEGVKSGRTLMLFPYGYIRLSEGADGDHVDCYVGPNEQAANVYVVRQTDPETGNYDEDKCFIGFDSEHAARLAFLAHRDDGDKAFGGITTYPVEEFREKVRATMKHPGAVKAFNPDQPRDAHGRFAPGGGGEHQGDENLSPARLSEMSPDKAERERARLREVHGRQREARRASAKERDRLKASRADQKDWAVRNTPAELKDKRTEMFGDRPIALKGDVSNLMASSVRVAYDNTIPQSVKDSLATARVSVTVARDSVAQALPRLADTQPRGWTEGSTFKQVDGVFSPTDFTAVVSEMHENAAGQPELSGRTAGVLRHEVGHAFDFSNAVKPGTGEGWASDQPTMIDAYEKDVAKQMSDYVSRIPEGLPPEEHAKLATRDFYSKNSDLAYFLQSGPAGRQEAFAEVFAQMHGTGSTRADVAAAFPNYRSEIEHYVKTGKVRASWE